MKRLFQTRETKTHGGLSLAALAPMVDLLTILIVVVLRTYSSDPPLTLENDPDFRLPQSVDERPTPRGITVDIANSGIYVDGTRVDSAEYWSNPENEVFFIDKLEARLEALGGNRAITRALIRADEDATWTVVGKVLFTIQEVGYEDIELVAESRASL